MLVAGGGIVVVLIAARLHVRQPQLGNFASQDFDICLHNFCGSFAEICGEMYLPNLEIPGKIPGSLNEDIRYTIILL